MASHDDEAFVLHTPPVDGELMSMHMPFELSCQDSPEPGHYFNFDSDFPVLGEEYFQPKEGYGVQTRDHASAETRKPDVLHFVSAIEWYKDRSMPQLDIEDLRPAYQQGYKAICFKELPYTVEAFQEHIGRGASVVQLSGHGYRQAGILFESAYTTLPVAVSSARLASMINCGQGIKTTCCVVIMSCDSMAIARCFLEAGVPHVVAIVGAVSDQAARNFSRIFHSRLDSGDSITSAFQAALNGTLANLEGKDPTAASTFHLMPAEANHDFAPFAEQSKGSWIDLSAKKYCQLPARPRWFEGSHSTKLLESLLRSVKQKRLVCVHGVAGSGKSALAVVAADHLQRHRPLVLCAPARCFPAASACAFPRWCHLLCLSEQFLMEAQPMLVLDGANQLSAGAPIASCHLCGGAEHTAAKGLTGFFRFRRSVKQVMLCLLCFLNELLRKYPKLTVLLTANAPLIMGSKDLCAVPHMIGLPPWSAPAALRLFRRWARDHSRQEVRASAAEQEQKDYLEGQGKREKDFLEAHLKSEELLPGRIIELARLFAKKGLPECQPEESFVTIHGVEPKRSTKQERSRAWRRGYGCLALLALALCVVLGVIFGAVFPPRAKTIGCDKGNGGCQQLCVDSPPGSLRCACLEGYILQADERTCVFAYPAIEGASDYGEWRRCGKNEESVSAKCGPTLGCEVDADCPDKLLCIYTWAFCSSTAAIPSKSRCGKTWGDGNSECGAPCGPPDWECSDGEECFSNLLGCRENASEPDCSTAADHEPSLASCSSCDGAICVQGTCAPGYHTFLPEPGRCFGCNATFVGLEPGLVACSDCDGRRCTDGTCAAGYAFAGGKCRAVDH